MVLCVIFLYAPVPFISCSIYLKLKIGRNNKRVFVFQKAEVPEKFQEELIAQLTEFTSCEKKTMYLPPQLTAQEELCVRQAAGERGLNVRSIEQRGEVQLCLSKPK